MSLEEIVEGCKKQDRACQQALYVLFAPKMRGACYNYTGSTQETKDVLHDGFLKVFSQITQYQGTGSLEGWIRRLIINTCLDYLKKRKKVKFTSWDESTEGLYSDHDQEADDDYNLDQFADLSQEDIIEKINELKDEYRIIFNMACLDNFSHKEIADKLGIKESSSRSKLRRAREILRKKLEDLISQKTGRKE